MLNAVPPSMCMDTCLAGFTSTLRISLIEAEEYCDPRFLTFLLMLLIYGLSVYAHLMFYLLSFLCMHKCAIRTNIK